MKRILIPIVSIVALILAACNQSTGDGQLPTLVALPTETATVEAQSQVIETEEVVETEEISETEEAQSTVEAEPDNTELEEPTYSLSDFDNPTLWRIVSSDIVNAYACLSEKCDVSLTYENGDLIRVVDTDNGWHTVLSLQSTLVYVEEEFTVFVQIIEDSFVTEEATAPTITPTATEEASSTGNTTGTTNTGTTSNTGSTTTSSGNPVTVINIPPQSGNNNNGGSNGNNGGGNNEVATATQVPQATITADPFFTPVVSPGNEAPPGVIINPTSSGPGAGGGPGAAPPGSSTATPGSQPPAGSGPPPP